MKDYGEEDDDDIICIDWGVLLGKEKELLNYFFFVCCEQSDLTLKYTQS